MFIPNVGAPYATWRKPIVLGEKLEETPKFKG